MKDYPWYKITDDTDIHQGDFFYSIPYTKPTEIFSESDAEEDIELFDIIVLSQSCDLVTRKLVGVLVCPIWTLSEFSEADRNYESNERREKLRRGEVVGYHLLKECDLKGFNNEILIADFKRVYSVPLGYLLNIAKKKEQRLRLLPPYREHLSQAFARFLMRVGLPIEIKPFV